MGDRSTDAMSAPILAESALPLPERSLETVHETGVQYVFQDLFIYLFL